MSPALAAQESGEDGGRPGAEVEEARRALGRLVDRLRIVGPRWSGLLARPADAPGGPTPAAVQAAEGLADVRVLLERLARTAATWEGRPAPDLAVDGGLAPGDLAHACADVLAVLGTDVLAALDPADETRLGVLAELTAALDELRRRC